MNSSEGEGEEVVGVVEGHGEVGIGGIVDVPGGGIATRTSCCRSLWKHLNSLKTSR